MALEFSIQVILRGLDQLTAPLRQVTAGMDRLAKSTEHVQKLGERFSSFGMRMGAAGLAIGLATKSTVDAFTELEQAQVQAQNAFSTASGISEFWKDINAQAIEAGNLYPGTSADFITLAASMKKAGADAQEMANGGFRAAAAIQVMFRGQGLGPDEAGRIFQTMQNALGIAGKDAQFFADQLQRVSYGSGLTIAGVAEGLKYAAAEMKQLGIQGKESAPLVLAVMGALRRGGLDDSQVGTAMSQFMTNIARAQARIHGGDTRGAAMKFAFQGLAEAGINLQFFDENKKFMGLANAIGQISQLKNASDQVRVLAAKALFGIQGGRMATGDFLGRVNEMLDRMKDQEALEKRLDRITNTLGNSIEALGGSFRNTLAAIGEKMAPVLKPLANHLNSILDRIIKWVDRNPELVGQLATSVAALGALLTVGGGVTWMVGGLASSIAKAIPVIVSLGSATWAAAPWLAAIAAAGYLIFTNWDTVGPIFSDVAEQMADVGTQVGALIRDVGGIVGLGDKMGKDMGIWATAAWSLAKALQLVVTGVEFLAAIGSVQKRLVFGPEGSSQWAGRMIGAFQRGKGIMGVIREGEAERKKIAAEQWSASWLDPFLKPFDKIAEKDPLGVGKAIHGESVASQAKQENHFQLTMQAPPGTDPQAYGDAVLEALRAKSDEVRRLMVSHQQVATRGAY